MVKSIFFLFALLLLLPKEASAQSQLVCPASWTTDPNTLAEDSFALDKDEYLDFKRLDYSYSFNVEEIGDYDFSPTPNKNVSVNVTTNVPTAVFTRIYANFVNVIYPFVNANSMDVYNALPEEKKDDWMRFYCLGGQRDESVVQQGTFTQKVEADLEALALIGKDVCVLIGGNGGIVDEKDPDNGKCETGYRLVSRRRVEVVSGSSTKEETNQFAMPYRLALRDIARKTAFTIKEQYCSTGAQQSCLNDNYVCVKEGDQIPGKNDVVVIQRNDPAAKGKDGMCHLKEEVLSKSSMEITAQRMCTDVNFNQQVSTLSSLICHFNRDKKLTYTPAAGTPYMTVNMSIGNDPQNSNSLPFDTELFDNNQEMENPNCDVLNPTADVDKCEINGYFRRALHDKLGRYTKQDIDLFASMKYRIGVASDSSVAYSVRTNPEQGYGNPRFPDAWTYDYVEKLGGYVLMSEEARVFNPDLLPAGDRVVSENGHEVYLRGGQVFFDNYVVTNRERYDVNGNRLDGDSLSYDEFSILQTAFSELRSVFFNVDRQGARDSTNRYEAQYRSQLRTEIVRKVFDLYLVYVRSQIDYLEQCVDRALVGQSGCISIKSQVDSNEEIYLQTYAEYRDTVGATYSGSNPTLDCHRSLCAVSYVSGSDIYVGITSGGDISRTIRVPLQAGTFAQISHRVFLTDEGHIVVFYTDIDNSFKLVKFNPGVTGGQPVYQDTGISALSQADMYYQNGFIHIAYYSDAIQNADRDKVFYQVYKISDNFEFIREITINPNGFPTGYFRPGPMISVVADAFNNAHLVFPVAEPDYAWNEGFAQRLTYVYLASPATQNPAPRIETIVDHAADKANGMLPQDPFITTSRILSNGGRSIYVTPSGQPIVVYINRVTNVPPDDVRPPWEMFMQGFVAKKTLRGWVTLPISDQIRWPYGELRNVFISPDSIGLTLNDLVTKRNSVTKMLDGAGLKKCVYTGTTIISLLQSGSTSCGTLQNIQYIKSNGGRLDDPSAFETPERPN